MRMSRVAGSTAAVLVAAGLAASASAVNITASSIYFFTGQDYGAGVGFAPGALNKPGDAGPTTWSWNANHGSQPQIDSNGRIYVGLSFAATPQINTVSTNNNAGIFTATSHTDLALVNSWATGQLDPSTGYPMVSNSGSSSGISTSNYLRTSGTSLALGSRYGNPGSLLPGSVFESTSGANFQNNSSLYVGNLGTQSFVARGGDAISTLPSSNDWTAAAANTGLGNVLASTYQNASTQYNGLNASGTVLSSVKLATTGANPATTATNSFLATNTAGGSYSVIARAGDLPFGAGGPAFKTGSNGVGGFNAKINRNGQVLYDAQFVTDATIGVSSANDNSGWIHTPGAGTRASQNTQVYQESLNVPTHVDPATGLQTSNGSATFSGSMNLSQRSFSNAGVLWVANPSGGDTVTTAGSANDQMLFTSTAAGGLTPTWMLRKNDIAPGFTGASGVRQGGISTSNMAMNNSGVIAYASGLQGNVQANVNPTFTTIFVPPFGLPRDAPPLITPGVMGNDTAVFLGTPGVTGPGGLRALARTGDPAPGFTGMYYNINPSNSGSVNLNNAGDLLFACSVVSTAAGTEYTQNGWQLAGGSNYPNQWSFSDVLFGYDAASGQVNPMLYEGQLIEVDPGVFKYVTQFTVNTTDNGDGSSMGLNDDGTFVAWVRTSDTPDGNATGTAYVVLQIPAPGTAMLGLLGVGALARRRRR